MLLNVGVVILVLLVGLFLAWHITNQLKVILNGLKALNSGLLNHQINSDSDDELGRTLGVKNEQDQLSSSLNQLVDTLDDTAQQATFIASGNYEVDNKLPHSKLSRLGSPPTSWEWGILLS
jgi:methyl-accepting chemotaxis protein